jgi:hypothetical protein
MTQVAIQGPILDRFADVVGEDVFGCGEVGYRAGDFQDAARPCSALRYSSRSRGTAGAGAEVEFPAVAGPSAAKSRPKKRSKQLKQ